MTRTTLLRTAASLLVAGSTIALFGQPLSYAASRPQVKEHASRLGASVTPSFRKGGFIYKHKPSFAPPDHDQSGGRKIPVGPFHARKLLCSSPGKRPHEP